jgi:hypothetical protein
VEIGSPMRRQGSPRLPRTRAHPFCALPAGGGKEWLEEALQRAGVRSLSWRGLGGSGVDLSRWQILLYGRTLEESRAVPGTAVCSAWF